MKFQIAAFLLFNTFLYVLPIGAHEQKGPMAMGNDSCLQIDEKTEKSITTKYFFYN